MPAMPPPMTSTLRVTGTPTGVSGSFLRARCTVERVILIAFSVALSLSLCTQAHCSRMLAISHWNGFRPPSAEASRKVFSCRFGEQQEMTTLSSLCSLMASMTDFWPGSEHM